MAERQREAFHIVHSCELPWGGWGGMWDLMRCPKGFWRGLAKDSLWAYSRVQEGPSRADGVVLEKS
jgi:hypothetical protein